MKNLSRRNFLAATPALALGAVTLPAASRPIETVSPELTDLITAWVDARAYFEAASDQARVAYENAPPKPEAGVLINDMFPHYHDVLGPTRYWNAEDLNTFCDRAHKLWFGKGVPEKIENGRAEGLALLAQRKRENKDWYIRNGLKSADDKENEAVEREDLIVEEIKDYPCQSVADVHAKIIWKYEVEQAWGWGVHDTFSQQLGVSFGDFEKLAFSRQVVV